MRFGGRLGGGAEVVSGCCRAVLGGSGAWMGLGARREPMRRLGPSEGSPCFGRLLGGQAWSVQAQLWSCTMAQVPAGKRTLRLPLR